MRVAFEELKAKQSAMWGSGTYERIEETLLAMHEAVLERVAPAPGERLLDVAGGTGQLARRAARRGAEVTVVDLSPVLASTGARLAEHEGVAVTHVVGDAENLPFADATFDVVVSTAGAMFAPDQHAVARELSRVCRPGGRLGLASWHPTRGVQQFFASLARFQPAPPAGIPSPFEWGQESSVRELLGDAFELSFELGDVPLTAASSDDAWDLFSTSFGPTKSLADSLEPERRAELREVWTAHYDEYRTDDGIVYPREYLLVLGTRR